MTHILCIGCPICTQELVVNVHTSAQIVATLSSPREPVCVHGVDIVQHECTCISDPDVLIENAEEVLWDTNLCNVGDVAYAEYVHG